MILLDTNVLSELMRPAPVQQVRQWLDAKATADIWISAITVAEIRLGLALLPDGQRKTLLAEQAELMFREEFAAACLPFDEQAAGVYATIVAQRKRQGRPITVEDAQIAAIALAADMTLATRNTKDFEGINGLQIFNPWLPQ